MSIISPAGDPSDNKHLWWRCVFVAAAVQPVLILLYFMFRSTSFGIILGGIFYLALANPTSLPILLILLPACIVLNSLVLGTIIYFVCWLKEKDF